MVDLWGGKRIAGCISGPEVQGDCTVYFMEKLMRELNAFEVEQTIGGLTVGEAAVTTAALMMIGAASPLVITAGSIALAGYGMMSVANYLNQ